MARRKKLIKQALTGDVEAGKEVVRQTQAEIRWGDEFKEIPLDIATQRSLNREIAPVREALRNIGERLY